MFERIGKNFKAKSGKATTIIISEAELKRMEANLIEDPKYGKQVKLVVTGTADSQYGHSVSLVVEQPEHNAEDFSGIDI